MKSLNIEFFEFEFIGLIQKFDNFVNLGLVDGFITRYNPRARPDSNFCRKGQNS